LDLHIGRDNGRTRRSVLQGTLAAGATSHDKREIDLLYPSLVLLNKRKETSGFVRYMVFKTKFMIK